MDPITIAKLWMTVRPIRRIKEARQRRRERRMAEKIVLTTPTGETIEHTPPTIAARTSTKVAVAGGVVGAFPAVELLSWVQGLQLEPAWLEAATNSPYFLYYGGLLIAYVVARFSKSPLAKQSI